MAMCNKTVEIFLVAFIKLLKSFNYLVLEVYICKIFNFKGTVK